MEISKVIVEQLMSELTSLKKLVKEQAAMIELLKEEVRQLKVTTTSNNSSKPPSSDLFKKKTTSLRGKSNKKNGGQFGHKGNTLKMVETPDIIENLKPKECKNCGTNLEGLTGKIQSQCQVLDIPPIKLAAKEYRKFQVNCPCCGILNTKDYPDEVRGNVQYGKNLRNLVVYLGTRQFIPIKRTVEMIATLLGQKISEGTVVNMLEEKKELLLPVYEQVKKELMKSKVVGSDETGCKVNGKKEWMWVVQNKDYNFIHLSQSRGFDTLEGLFPNGLKNTIVISDRWKAQLKLATKGKQLCIPHLVRNTQELVDRYSLEWANSLITVFLGIMKACQKRRIPSALKNDLCNKLDLLLAQQIEAKYPKAITLQKSLLKYRPYLTTCLFNRKVPPDNNASERAIRNIKVKTKVSGGFRSLSGAKTYAVIRSIIDSGIKKGIHPFSCLLNPSLLLD